MTVSLPEDRREIHSPGMEQHATAPLWHSTCACGWQTDWDCFDVVYGLLVRHTKIK